jgi:hypothetical protein
MRKICAWCQRPMNQSPEDDTRITHGICGPCFQSAENRLAVKGLDLLGLAIGGDEKGKRTRRPF